ncbi:hypothetical protein MNBD_ALPHA04-1571 [hydrothermal vent metagenome]|uniref:Iron-sulfur cluster assembly scaffold protein for SUF system, SufE2 n=1 Tax=hydrothermal vent metagenome TaxID=652676 RepID=A0A3B0S5N5_9ZZZZ
MSEGLYSREILRLAVSIPHQERLTNPDASAELRSRTCGSRAVIDVIISKDGRLKQLGIEINACALGQASAAILGAEAIGKKASEVSEARRHLAGYLAGNGASSGDWKNINMLDVAKDHKGRHAAILLPFETLIVAFDKALAKRKAA